MTPSLSWDGESRMTYLSKVLLNPLRSGAQKLLANPQAMHAAVLGGVPPGVEGRVLWREDSARRSGGLIEAVVLVQTPVEPDWSHLIEQAGWQTEEGQALVRPLDPLLDALALGRRFQFRLRANPVRAVGHGEGRRGTRRGVGRAELQLDWFLTRTSVDNAQWGFTVNMEPHPHVQVVARDQQTFTKGADKRRVTISRATFAGELQVTDATALRETLLSGSVSAKAYACGLLTLAPGACDVVSG